VAAEELIHGEVFNVVIELAEDEERHEESSMA